MEKINHDKLCLTYIHKVKLYIFVCHLETFSILQLLAKKTFDSISNFIFFVYVYNATVFYYFIFHGLWKIYNFVGTNEYMNFQEINFRVHWNISIILLHEKHSRENNLLKFIIANIFRLSQLNFLFPISFHLYSQIAIENLIKSKLITKSYNLFSYKCFMQVYK